jgi:molybdopterin-guanine dinucleotide biosynthesis protein A
LRTVPADVAFVCDPEPDEGPAAGLATALGAVRNSSVAVVACDMPFVDARFLEWLFGELSDADGAVPYVDGSPQPTHAVFATEPTRRAANEAHDHASGSLREVLDKLDIVEIPEARVLDRTEKASFLDVNTPTELEALSSKSKE